MALENYYNILGIDQDAASEDVQKAIAEKRREWTPRTGHPKLETRQLAEQTIKNIAEAESILLDGLKRREYDQQLAAQVSVPEPSLTDVGGRDWLQIARDYLAQGNTSQANYAAREATAQRSEDPEAWYIRGLSSEQLGNGSDAEFELNEAIRLNPNDASYRAELGDLYRSNSLWAKALPEYTRASQLDPSNVFYSAGMGIAEGALGNHRRAHDLLKAAYEKAPDADIIRYFYGLVLIDMITGAWSTFHDGSQSILTENQLEYTREKLAIIDSLKIADTDFRNDLDEIRVEMERAAKVTLRFGSCGEIAGIAGVLPVVAALLVMWLLAAISGYSANPGVISVIVFVTWIAAFVLVIRWRRMPGWKWNWKQSPAYVRKTGLQ